MTMGNISLSQGALLDVSADSAGTVRIRGGQFMMDNATISADTGASNGAPLAVDIAVTGEFSIFSDLAPAITAQAIDSGNAGEIRLAASKLNASFGSPDFSALIPLIDSHTVGTGNGGQVSITVGELTAGLTLPSLSGAFIDGGTGGEGNGGDVTIKAGKAEFHTASIYLEIALSEPAPVATSLLLPEQHGRFFARRGYLGHCVTQCHGRGNYPGSP
jgi:hypothetical protein